MASMNLQAKRPFRFIVGLFIPLNWKRHIPDSFRTRKSSRM